MLTMFKPYGTIEEEKKLYGEYVNVVGVDSVDPVEREKEVEKKLRTCDILQADVDIHVNKEYLKNAENLRAVLCCSIGTDYIEIDEVTELGIMVCNNPDFCVEAVAELTIGLMFSIIRQIPRAAIGVMNNNWNIRRKTVGNEIIGKTFGLIGFGKIGREVARMAKGLGMKVMAYDPYMNTEVANNLGVYISTFDDVLTQSDVISIHVPLMETTKNLINKDSISKMKDGSYIINVSRGGIINEQDLVEAVLSGKIHGAGLDVLTKEPPDDDPLLGHIDQNILITPHTAWHSFEANKKFQENFIKQLKMISEGEVPVFLLNREVINSDRVKKWLVECD